MSRTEDYAQAVLERMKEKAIDSIWEGKMTELVAEVGAPSSYYSRVMRALRDSGAIRQTRRGGGPTLSRYVIENPDAKIVSAKPTVTVRRHGDLEDRVAALEHNVGGFDVKGAILDLANDVKLVKQMLGKE